MPTTQPPPDLDGYDTAKEPPEDVTQPEPPAGSWRSTGGGNGATIKTERWELP